MLIIKLIDFLIIGKYIQIMKMESAISNGQSGMKLETK